MTGSFRSRRSRLGLAVAALLLVAAASLSAAVTRAPVPRRLVVYPLPAKDGVRIDATHDVILVRWRRAVYAFARSSLRRGTTLDRLGIQLSGDAVTVDLREVYHQDKDPVGWNGAMALIGW